MNSVFDASLGPFTDLLTLGRKDLDTVVLVRVVRGANNNTGVERELLCYERDTRGRDDARRFAEGTFGGRTHVKSRLDPFTRFSRITARDESRGAAETLTILTGKGSADQADRRTVQWKCAGPPPNAVRSE